MKLVLVVLFLLASSAHADSLTVNLPLRADTYTGDLLSFSPLDSAISFNVVSDDAHQPPMPDRILSSDFDVSWSIWNIELCDEGSCGTVRHICKLSNEAPTLDCLDVDC